MTTTTDPAARGRRRARCAPGPALPRQHRSAVSCSPWSHRRVDVEVVVRSGAAAALLGAAVVHSTVIGEHYAEWQLAGTFFVVLQVVETLLSLAVVLAWSRITALAVALSSLGTVAVWLVSRTAGMPFGPPAFRHPEAVGVADVACGVLELLAASLVLTWAAPRRHPVGRDAPARRSATLLVATPLVLLAVAVTVTGVRPSLAGGATPGDANDTSVHTH